MIIYRKGDLLKAFDCGEVATIAHGCNCFHTMRKGIAKQIKENYDIVQFVDIEFTDKGDRNKLGTLTYSSVTPYALRTAPPAYGVMFHDHIAGTPSPKHIIDTSHKYIINAYTQYTYWNCNDMLYLDAVESCMQLIHDNWYDHTIGIPKIGCGLARGDWNKVESIIGNIFSDIDIYVYEL
jgi:O-acetyl-ADP-ribose deacetylase (regulator of RNase III)